MKLLGYAPPTTLPLIPGGVRGMGVAEEEEEEKEAAEGFRPVTSMILFFLFYVRYQLLQTFGRTCRIQILEIEKNL